MAYPRDAPGPSLRRTRTRTWNAGEQGTGIIDQSIDLIAHKKPNLKVMEINKTAGDWTNVWLDNLVLVRSSRVARDKCSFVTNDAAQAQSVFLHTLVFLLRYFYDILPYLDFEKLFIT